MTGTQERSRMGPRATVMGPQDGHGFPSHREFRPEPSAEPMRRNLRADLPSRQNRTPSTYPPPPVHRCPCCFDRGFRAVLGRVPHGLLLHLAPARRTSGTTRLSALRSPRGSSSRLPFSMTCRGGMRETSPTAYSLTGLHELLFPVKGSWVANFTLFSSAVQDITGAAVGCREVSCGDNADAVVVVRLRKRQRCECGQGYRHYRDVSTKTLSMGLLVLGYGPCCSRL